MAMPSNRATLICPTGLEGAASGSVHADRPRLKTGTKQKPWVQVPNPHSGHLLQEAHVPQEKLRFLVTQLQFVSLVM